MQKNKLELINYFISIGVTSGSWPKKGCSSPNLPNILTGWGWIEVAGHEYMVAYQQGSWITDIIKSNSDIALTVDEYSRYLAAQLDCKSAVMQPAVENWSKAFTPQPQPNGQGDPVLGFVLADLTNRALVGKEKYGEPLKILNGRSSITDFMQELYDAAMYAKQMELELEVIGSELDSIAETLLSMDGMDKASCEAAGLALSKVIAKFKAFR